MSIKTSFPGVLFSNRWMSRTQRATSLPLFSCKNGR